MFIGAPFAVLLGVSFMEEQRRRSAILSLRFASHGNNQDLVKWEQPRDAALVARFILKNKVKSAAGLDELAQLTDRIVMSARAQYPKSVHVVTIQASVACFQGNAPGAACSLVEKARRTPTMTRLERWESFLGACLVCPLVPATAAGVVQLLSLGCAPAPSRCPESKRPSPPSKRQSSKRPRGARR